MLFLYTNRNVIGFPVGIDLFLRAPAFREGTDNIVGFTSRARIAHERFLSPGDNDMTTES